MADLFAGAPSFARLVGQILNVTQSNDSDLLQRLPKEIRQQVTSVDIQWQNNTITAEGNNAPKLIQDIIDYIKKSQPSTNVDQLTNIANYVREVQSKLNPLKQLYNDVLQPSGTADAVKKQLPLADAVKKQLPLVESKFVQGGSENINPLEMLNTLQSFSDPDSQKQLKQASELRGFFSIITGVETDLTLYDKMSDTDKKTHVQTEAQRQIERLKHIGTILFTGDQLNNFNKQIDDWQQKVPDGSNRTNLQQLEQLIQNNLQPDIRDQFEYGLGLTFDNLVSKSEKVKRDKFGNIIPVADMINATIGLKTKGTAGIAIDALLNPLKSFSDFVNDTVQNYQVAESSYNFFTNGQNGTGPVDVDTFIKQLGKYTDAPEYILSNKYFREQLEQQRGDASDTNIQRIYTGFNNYLNAQLSAGNISQSEYNQMSNIQYNIQGQLISREAYKKSFEIQQDNVKYDKNSGHPIDLVASKLQPIFKTQVINAITNEERNSIISQVRSISDLVGVDIQQYDPVLQRMSQLVNLDATTPSSNVSMREELEKIMFDSGGNPEKINNMFRKFREYEYNNLVNIQSVMMQDPQKALDKSNTQVFISTILSDLQNNQKYDPNDSGFMQLINSSLYNALNAGNIEQFNQTTIISALYQNRQNLASYGFQSDFIEEFGQQVDKIVASGTKLSDLDQQTAQKFLFEGDEKYGFTGIRSTRNKPNLQQLTRFLYEDMLNKSKLVVSSNQPESLKLLTQYTNMQTYINMSKALGNKQNADMMTQSLVSLGVVETMQDVIVNSFNKTGIEAMNKSQYQNLFRMADNVYLDPNVYNKEQGKYISNIQKMLNISEKDLSNTSIDVYNDVIEELYKERKFAEEQQNAQVELYLNKEPREDRKKFKKGQQVAKGNQKSVKNNRKASTYRPFKSDVYNLAYTMFSKLGYFDEVLPGDIEQVFRENFKRLSYYTGAPENSTLFIPPDIKDWQPVLKDAIIKKYMDDVIGDEWYSKFFTKDLAEVYSQYTPDELISLKVTDKKKVSFHGLQDDFIKLEAISRLAEENADSYKNVTKLAKVRQYNDYVDYLSQTPYAGQLQIAEIAWRQMEPLTNQIIEPFREFGTLNDMSRYRLLREPKDSFLQITSQTNRGFDMQVKKGGSYGKYRQLIQGDVYSQGTTLDKQLPSLFRKKTWYLSQNGQTNEDLQNYKQEIRNQLKKIDEQMSSYTENVESQQEESEFEEEEQIRKGLIYKLYHTGIVVPFDQTKSGGLFVTPSLSSDYYEYSSYRAHEVQNKVFVQPKIVYSAMKYGMGSNIHNFTRFMYNPSNMGLPIGTYTTVNSSVKSDIMQGLSREFIRRQYTSSRFDFTFEGFEYERQAFMSSNLVDTDREMQFIYGELFDQSQLTEYLQSLSISPDKASREVLEDFIQLRLGKDNKYQMQDEQKSRLVSILSNRLLDTNGKPITFNYDSKNKAYTMTHFVYDDATKTFKERTVNPSLPEFQNVDMSYIIADNTLRVQKTRAQHQMEQLYYKSQNMRAGTFDVQKTQDYLLFPHRFDQQGVQMWLVPHNLVDAISVSSPNVVGSVVSLKPYGHYATPIQEQLNPVAFETDTVRQINTMGQSAPWLSIDHSARQTDKIVEEIYQINRNKRKFLLTQRFGNVFQDEFETSETDGLIVPMLVMNKEGDEMQQFLRNVLGTDLNFAGDQVFMYKPLQESLRYVTIGKYGEFETRPVPELTKWTGVARSKGISTFLFDRPLQVKINGKLVSVGGIMNDQSKRKNKMAEFGLGQLRQYRYIYGDNTFEKAFGSLISSSQGYKGKDASSILNNLPIFNVSDMEGIVDKNQIMTNIFMDKMVGEVFVTENGKEFATGMRLPLIFMKMYNYAGKSQNVKWSEMSPMQAQVLPQLRLFRQSGMLGMLFAGDPNSRTTEESIMLQNLTSTSAEGQQAGMVQQLMEKNVIGTYKTRTGYIKRQAGIKSQRNMTLMDQMKSYVNLFGQARSQRVVHNNQQRLLYTSQQFMRAAGVNPQMRRTAELLQLLGEIASNQRTTLDTGTSVLSISEQQARRLQEFAGDEVLLPQIGIDFLRKLTKNADLGVRNQWSEFHEVDELISIAEEQGNIQTIQTRNEGKTTYARMLRLRTPKLFGYTGSTFHLSLEGETFINTFQGAYSLIQYAQKNDRDQLEGQFPFYASRQMQLGNIQTRGFIRGLNKKHGTQIYATHATARHDLGGVRAPEKQFKVLMASQLKSGQISETELRQYFTDDKKVAEFKYLAGLDLGTDSNGNPITLQSLGFSDMEQSNLQQIRDKGDVDTLFSRWKNQVILVNGNAGGKRNAAGKHQVFMSRQQQSTKYTNNRDIVETVTQNVPVLRYDQLNNYEVSVLSVQDDKFANQIANRLQEQYQQFLGLTPETIPQQNLRTYMRGVSTYVPKSNEFIQEYAGSVALGKQGYGNDWGKRFIMDSPYMQVRETFAKSHGELWGAVERHPIIGQMPHARIAGFSQNNTIDVPQPLAVQIAGDDDGDMLDLLPYIIIGPELFQNNVAEVTKYGIYSLTMQAQLRANLSDTSEYQQEIRHLYFSSLYTIDNEFEF